MYVWVHFLSNLPLWIFQYVVFFFHPEDPGGEGWKLIWEFSESVSECCLDGEIWLPASSDKSFRPRINFLPTKFLLICKLLGDTFSMSSFPRQLQYFSDLLNSFLIIRQASLWLMKSFISGEQKSTDINNWGASFKVFTLLSIALKTLQQWMASFD